MESHLLVHCVALDLNVTSGCLDNTVFLHVTQFEILCCRNYVTSGARAADMSVDFNTCVHIQSSSHRLHRQSKHKSPCEARCLLRRENEVIMHKLTIAPPGLEDSYIIRVWLLKFSDARSDMENYWTEREDEPWSFFYSSLHRKGNKEVKKNQDIIGTHFLVFVFCFCFHSWQKASVFSGTNVIDGEFLMSTPAVRGKRDDSDSVSFLGLFIFW